MGIAGSQQLVGRELIVLVQQNGTILDVVDVGTYLVHTIRGGDGHHIVYTRIAEYTISQVDGLVAAVAQEYHILGHPLHLLQHTFQFALQRVGITVVGCVIRILVGIQKHMRLMARILIAG